MSSLVSPWAASLEKEDFSFFVPRWIRIPFRSDVDFFLKMFHRRQPEIIRPPAEPTKGKVLDLRLEWRAALYIGPKVRRDP